LEWSPAHYPGFERRRRVIGQFVQRLQDQPWQSVRCAAVRDALERSERRVKKAGTRAQHDPDPEQVHRWRRKLRRLRMQLDAAQHIGALHGREGHAAVVRKAKSLHRTSDQLGWQQDLRLLRNLVRNLPASAGKSEVLATIERALVGAGERLQEIT
jgi:CHAD domain-containing protein